VRARGADINRRQRPRRHQRRPSRSPDPRCTTPIAQHPNSTTTNPPTTSQARRRSPAPTHPQPQPPRWGPSAGPATTSPMGPQEPTPHSQPEDAPPPV
jgi:hypothetical protein